MPELMIPYKEIPDSLINELRSLVEEKGDPSDGTVQIRKVTSDEGSGAFTINYTVDQTTPT